MTAARGFSAWQAHFARNTPYFRRAIHRNVWKTAADSRSGVAQAGPAVHSPGQCGNW